jgi:DNA-binding NarL/FixJ family response regulator
VNSAERPTGTFRVVVADDDPFTISLVQGALEAQGFVVTTAVSAASALEAIDEVELNLGAGESGASLLSRVSEQYPWIGLVVLTSHRSPALAVEDPHLIPSSVVYLVKSRLSGMDELAEAVHQAIGGHAVDDVRHEDGIFTITSAQAEVLRLLAEGASTKALAEHRGTTVRAVETMLVRLYSALELDGDDRLNPRVEALLLLQQGRIRVRSAPGEN